jgi:hypothetical protein
MKPLSVVTAMMVSLLVSSSQLTAGEKSWCLVTLAGDTLCNCSLDSLFGTSIVSRHAGVRVLVPLDSVATFFQPGESHAWTGFAIGAFSGATLGAVVGVETYKKPEHEWDLFGKEVAAVTWGFLGGLIGGLTGAAIGASSGGEEITIEKNPLENKVQVVKYLHSGKVYLAKELSIRERYR